EIMKQTSRGTHFPIACAILLCGGAFPLWAGVEDLLDPIDFSAYEKKSSLVAHSTPGTQALPVKAASIRVPTLAAIKKEDLEARLGEALVNRFGLHGEMQVEVGHLNLPKVSGKWTLELLQASPERPAPSAVLRFVIRTSFGKSGPITLPVRCRHIDEIYVAGRALNRGDRLSSAVLQKRLVDVLRENVRIISSEVDLEGYEFMGSVSTGSPIRWNHVKSIPSIRKGQMVNVYAAGKGIYISMKGLAMQDGGNGEHIKIRNPSSKQEFQAKVLNENSVKVYF
ncbi:MAG: flagellar basal body P-ring formation chaperone FlgA, partial [Opitutales bacterium]